MLSQILTITIVENINPEVAQKAKDAIKLINVDGELNSISKKVVTLVLGGSHSIGVPLATAGDYSFIAPTATMVVHPIRTNGLVIGINETFEYFKKMQERITQFILRTSILFCPEESAIIFLPCMPEARFL